MNRPIIRFETAPESEGPERPSDIPDDWKAFYFYTPDGQRLFGWGRIVETLDAKGGKKLTVEGFIPES